MTIPISPVEVLPAEPGRDYQARYRIDGNVRQLRVNAASYYEVWLIMKRTYPMASVVAILLVTV